MAFNDKKLATFLRLRWKKLRSNYDKTYSNPVDPLRQEVGLIHYYISHISKNLAWITHNQPPTPKISSNQSKPISHTSVQNCIR
jgi:hypothetical protein